MSKKNIKKTGIKKEAKPKRKFRINWLLVFALICVAIPTGALGWILYQASLETGIPQVGTRFDGAFVYQLNDNDIQKIKNELSSISGVNKVEVFMKVATVRIYLDSEDTLNEEQIKTITLEAYEKVNALYPIAQYFTIQGEATQYDLEIYAYNNMDFEDNFIYYRLVRNAPSVVDPIPQNVGVAIDPELADRLRRNVKLDNSGTTGVEGNDDSGDEETNAVE